MTDTEYAGRHRKTSPAERTHHIMAGSVHAGILSGCGNLYVSLADAATGNILGIDFEAPARNSLRRVLNRVSS